MAGHSKWAKIKHQKAISDVKKGKIFSKLSQQITIVARDGGGDPNANPSLRLLMDKAKAEGMPSDNVNRAIAKGTGEGNDGVVFESAMYEGFGPGGVGVIVDVVSDNTNRTVAELRNLFSESGGRLADSGALAWNFDQKGLVVVRCGRLVKSEKYGGEDTVSDADKDQVIMDVMDIDGVQDIEEVELEDGQGLEVYCVPVDLTKVRDRVMELGYIVRSAELVRIAKMYKELTDEELQSCIRFIEKIEDNNDVQDVWTDIDPEKLDI